jgi:hypothetical protein
VFITHAHLFSFAEELLKSAAPLTESARSHISNKNFALNAKQSNTGKPAYPIEDQQHARSALGFVKMHGSASERAEVYKDVAKKYPHLIKKQAAVAGALGKAFGEGSRIGDHLIQHGHAYDLAGLGVLAAPPVHNLAHAVKTKVQGGQVDKKEVGHSLAEVGGLGVLAAPVAAQMLRHR